MVDERIFLYDCVDFFVYMVNMFAGVDECVCDRSIHICVVAVCVGR